MLQTEPANVPISALYCTLNIDHLGHTVMRREPDVRLSDVRFQAIFVRFASLDRFIYNFLYIYNGLG